MTMDLSRGAGKYGLQVAKKLKQAGHTAYFAGGCVRDYLMHKEPRDFDIATSATPEAVESLFPKTVAVGRQFGVILVVCTEEYSFEVATFRCDMGYQDGRHPTGVSFTGPEEDSKRRDFTANGLFYDPFDKKVIDYVGGKGDIEKKVIRAIGIAHQRFGEDKLRLLRAVRFASSLGFDIAEETWEALKKSAPLIHEVSPERIRDELVKLLTRKDPARGLEMLSDSGLLKEILPEVEAMKGVDQPPEYHPEGDVFTHTCMLLERLDHPTPTLAMAALLHDVAKPVTYQVRNGRICFYEHAPIGADMTEKIMRRLRFSNQEIEDVRSAVGNHMKFADVQKMREGKLKRFVRSDNFDEELELHRIDCEASHGMLDNYNFLKSKMTEYEKEDLKPPPLLTGHDLIALGMKPGPGMKPLLDEAYDLQLEGKLGTKADAIAWVQNRKKT